MDISSHTAHSKATAPSTRLHSHADSAEHSSTNRSHVNKTHQPSSTSAATGGTAVLKHAPFGRGSAYSLLSWLLTIFVAGFGGLLRIWRLSEPRAVVFDETYYVKDAWTMLMTGEARDWPKTITLSDTTSTIDKLFASGNTDQWLPTAEYVVHPPIGKWLISLGLKFFGGATNIAAWRISVAIAGIIAIAILMRVALRLFHNLPIAVLAGVLMSVDGVGITMSRTGLLDNFTMVFALGAFSMLLIHRDWARERLREQYAIDASARSARWIPSTSRFDRDHPLLLVAKGPRLAFSWWRFAAAILLGLATGVKWSGIYFFAVFCVLSVVWDAWERRRVGYARWLHTGLLRDTPLTALYMLPLLALTYVASWTGWFLHSDSYMHDWAANHPGEGVTWLPDTLRSFVQYHIQMWKFHTTLDTPHNYMANPLTWPLQIRPTSFYWERVSGHPGLCSLQPQSQCVAAVTSLGNPLIWWIGSACALALLVLAILRKYDWRMWAVWAGFLGGWLPWAQYMHRTTFTFYSIVILPWIILAICAMADWLRHHASKRIWQFSIGIPLGAILVISAFFYPIWTAMPVPYEFWLSHMWFQSWI